MIRDIIGTFAILAALYGIMYVMCLIMYNFTY